VLLDVEAALRALVRSVFSSLNPEWSTRIPRSVRGDLEKARERESRDIWSPVHRTELLDYATFDQLSGLVLNSWPEFEGIFQDKQRTNACLKRFRDWRNVLAHGYQPNPSEALEALQAASDLGTKIPVDVLMRERGLPMASQESALDGRTTATFGLQSVTIIWVDDHPENNRGERRTLESLGATVIPALDNDEAVTLATEHVASLVVSDVARDSGRETGLDLPQRLQSNGINVPVIFYVGFVEDDQPLPKGSSAIADDPADLLRLVLATLDRRGLIRSHRLGSPSEFG
jgi:CheY-like chemotaxis protein